MSNKKNTVKTAVSLLLFVILLFDVCFLTKSVFGVFEQKRDNPIYFSESLDLTFDAENSDAVLAELKTLTENALTYTSMKSDLTLFENYPYVQSEIDSIKKGIERERADTLYFAAQQLESGTVTVDMTENGFIVLSQNAGSGTLVEYEGKAYYAEVDEEKINEYYDEQLLNRAEEFKLNASTVYRESKEYLDSLKDVSYSVTVNGEAVTNSSLTGQDISNKLSQNSGKSIYIKLSQSKVSSSEATGGISGEREKAVTSAAESFGKDAEIFFEFGSMLFNESLESVQKLHDECTGKVLKNIVFAAVTALLALALIIAIVIFLPTGERQGKVHKTVIVVLGVIFAALILLSVYLLANSVKLYFEPTLGTSWITVDSGSIIAKACFRACLAAVGITGVSVCIKTELKKRN
ncbi:MAG: hypothetical protein ACI4SB_01475 [Acutalibacteraceae bacterium]